VVKVLKPRIELISESLLHTLKNIVRRCFVSRKTKSSVTAVFVGNMVQVPKISLQTIDVSSDRVASYGKSYSTVLISASIFSGVSTSVASDSEANNATATDAVVFIVVGSL